MHIGGRAHGDAALGGKLPDRPTFAFHDGAQPGMDFLQLPVVALLVLHPFEIGHGHAAGIGEDVRQHDHVAASQDLVGFGRHRPVGQLQHQPRLHGGGVVPVDHVFQRGRHQHVAVHPHQIGGAERFMSVLAGGGDDRKPFLLGSQQGFEVEAACGAHRTAGIGNGDDPVAVSRHQRGDVLAGIAETLDRDAQLPVEAEIPGQVAHQIVAAARRRVAAAERAAQRDRLAGDDGRRGLADDLGIFVGHPAHDHGVGVDVGRGNVAVGADDARERLHVGARQALQLGLGQRARIDLHRPLAAAIGQVHDRAFEGHPEGKHLHLLRRGVGMEADAALGGAARVVVAASPGQERFSRAVVHADHQTDFGGLAREFQLLDHVGVDVDVLGGFVETNEGAVEKVAFGHRQILSGFPSSLARIGVGPNGRRTALHKTAAHHNDGIAISGRHA